MPAKITQTISALVSGEYCGCFIKLGQARATVQQLLRCGIKVGTELRKGRHLAVLGKSSLTGPATDFIAVGLRRGANPDTERPVFTAGRMP